MADLLEQGAQFLDDQRHAHMTRTIVYLRGGSVVEVAATVGQTTFEQADEFGGIQRLESRDFLIRTGELILDSAVALPQAGDRIRETVGDQAFVYEVMAPGSEPPFRYSDPYRKALRIHTKHVATEAA
ncbi:MAG: hypothetical protein KJO18_04660 [Acidimicrobiia bacterium]|nr:hypothetical protein [Acidimicrobiia bacterium]